MDRDIFAHYLGLVLGLGLEPLASISASALASRCLASLTSLYRSEHEIIIKIIHKPVSCLAVQGVYILVVYFLLYVCAENYDSWLAAVVKVIAIITRMPFLSLGAHNVDIHRISCNSTALVLQHQ